MKEGEKEEIDVDIEIPSTILRGVLDNSPKGKAEDAIDCRSCKPMSRPVAGTATGRSEKVRRFWDQGLRDLRIQGIKPDWDAHRQTLEGHDDSVNAVAFSPDGQVVASASTDKTVRLWDAATGAHRQTFEGHNDWVTAVAFSPDGQVVASASIDKTVRLWDAATGAHLQTLPLGVAETLAFHSSSSTLLLTDFGAVDLLTNSLSNGPLPPPDETPLSPTFCNIGLSPERTWVMLGDAKILWLPIEYRPTCSAVRGSTIFLGCRSGRVTQIVATIE